MTGLKGSKPEVQKLTDTLYLVSVPIIVITRDQNDKFFNSDEKTWCDHSNDEEEDD
jgi:hypothetical protein